MTAIVALLIAFTLLFLISRAGAVALELTGVPAESARFQSLSALTGVGFTTSESETIVRHSSRRRVVVLLMFIGSVGTLGVGTTLVVSFVGADDPADWIPRIAWVGGGFMMLCLLDRSHSVTRAVSRLTRAALQRWTRLGATDFSGLLYSTKDYTFAEIIIEKNHWMLDRTLSDLELRKEGIAVLGIYRSDGDYLSLPPEETQILLHHKVVAYGKGSRLTKLATRAGGKAGDACHADNVSAETHSQPN